MYQQQPQGQPAPYQQQPQGQPAPYQQPQQQQQPGQVQGQPAMFQGMQQVGMSSQYPPLKYDQHIVAGENLKGKIIGIHHFQTRPNEQKRGHGLPRFSWKLPRRPLIRA